MRVFEIRHIVLAVFCVLFTTATVSANPDIYEEDDSSEQASVIVLNSNLPQSHNFHDPGDADWVKFYAIKGETYTISARNMGNSDILMELRDGYSRELIQSQNNGGEGKDENLFWNCTQENIYYVKIHNADPDAWYKNSEYDLEIYCPDTPPGKKFEGNVINTITEEPVENAWIRTSGNAYALSDSEGNFAMFIEPGTYNLTLEALGFEPFMGTVEIPEQGLTEFHISMELGNFISPKTGKVGEDIEITWTNGNGCFDENTNVSVYPNSDDSNQFIISANTSSAKEVVIIGDTAYVADGNSGLQIIKISSQLVINETMDTPGTAMSVAVKDNFAYVADGHKGLQIIDINEVAEPSIIGDIDTPGIASCVVVKDNTAYVADDHRGLQLINISTPSVPETIGQADTPGRAMSVAIKDNFAYVADGYEGLQIVDISNPYEPEIRESGYRLEYAEDIVIKDSMAYIADGDNGLQIIDVTTPSAPVFVSSLDTEGYARGITLVGNTAYMADGDNGLLAADVSEPEHPEVLWSSDTPGDASAVFVVGNTAFIADGDKGLAMMPIPFEIESVTTHSEIKISFTIPSPLIRGSYVLRATTGCDDPELSGNIFFTDPDRPVSKAIIVAGRISADDVLWEATRTCTNRAYTALLSRGYADEDICYLSSESVDVNGDSKPDVDNYASKNNLRDAITDWAKDPARPAEELLVYITNHGGNGKFQIKDDQILDAKDLDAWLDELQKEDMPVKIIVIYDACYSGTFIPLLTPPEGKERIVITSSSPDKEVEFNTGGKLSFSWQFWNNVVSEGGNLWKSFCFGRDMVKSLDQTPYLDANGDGIGYLEAEMDYDKPDKKNVENIIIGVGGPKAAAAPQIRSISEAQILSGETSATIQVSDILTLNPLTRVWALITPPDYAPVTPGVPVTDLPTLEFEYSYSDNDGTYSGQGTYSSFDRNGVYKITVYATDNKDAYALPVQTTVTQTKDGRGPKGDLSRDGDVNLADVIIALKVLSGETGVIAYDYAAAEVDVNENNIVGWEEVFYVFENNN